ncbi:MAG: GatB/YqeY domain-containing protein [Rhodospirillaceae bacterium]
MLREKLSEELKVAMRARNQPVVGTIRMVMAGIKDRDIAARPKGNATGVDDGEILNLLRSMIKQRQESIELYRQGGRQELADKEAAEILVIEGFMPRQMSDDETKAAVEAVIEAIAATSVKDMGKVMAELRLRHAGVMDFGKASPMVKLLLN